MSLADIKRLREMTSLGINDCKKALSAAGGNFEKALQVLKEKGAQVLARKSSRSATQGVVESYIHFDGNLGALVEVNCETDFVARTDIFKKFAKDVAMQVAAASPEYISKENVPKDVAEAQEDLTTYLKQHCLMEQAFIRDNKISIADYLREVVSQSGENIVIRRFVRFAVGETDES